MRKNWIMLLLLLCATGTLSAQKSSKLKGAIGYFRAGYNLMSVGDLNSQLTAQNLPGVSAPSFSTGGGGLAINKNWLLGGEGYGFISQKNTANGYTNQYDGGRGEFMLGYALVHKKTLFLAPVLGIGGYHFQMDLHHDLGSGNSFNQVLSNPNNATQLKEHGWAASGKLLYEIKFMKFLFLGLEAGYNYSLSTSKWAIYGQAISTGPKTTLDGAFFGLSIGGGFIGN